MATEAHGYRVAIHVEHDMVKPLAKQFDIADYHVNSVPGSNEHVAMVVPSTNERTAKEFSERIVAVRDVLPRLFVGVAIEKYALSDGDTLDRVWVAA